MAKSFILYLFFLLFIPECKENKIRVQTNPKSNTFTSNSPVKKVIKPKVKTKPITIGIIPLGNGDADLFVLLKSEIQAFYQINTTILPARLIPESAYYRPRNRYIADSILDYLEKIKPKEIDYLLGITAVDISTEKPPYENWGIFGLGVLSGPSCVISYFRVKPSAVSQHHFEERMIKIALHELGHNFGLDHCQNESCLMEDAEGTIKTIDREKKALCSKCRSNKLASSTPPLL